MVCGELKRFSFALEHGAYSLHRLCNSNDLLFALALNQRSRLEARMLASTSTSSLPSSLLPPRILTIPYSPFPPPSTSPLPLSTFTPSSLSRGGVARRRERLHGGQCGADRGGRVLPHTGEGQREEETAGCEEGLGNEERGGEGGGGREGGEARSPGLASYFMQSIWYDWNGPTVQRTGYALYGRTWVVQCIWWTECGTIYVLQLLWPDLYGPIYVVQ